MLASPFSPSESSSGHPTVWQGWFLCSLAALLNYSFLRVPPGQANPLLATQEHPSLQFCDAVGVPGVRYLVSISPAVFSAVRLAHVVHKLLSQPSVLLQVWCVWRK